MFEFTHYYSGRHNTWGERKMVYSIKKSDLLNNYYHPYQEAVENYYDRQLVVFKTGYVWELGDYFMNVYADKPEAIGFVPYKSATEITKADIESIPDDEVLVMVFSKRDSENKITYGLGIDVYIIQDVYDSHIFLLGDFTTVRDCSNSEEAIENFEWSMNQKISIIPSEGAMRNSNTEYQYAIDLDYNTDVPSLDNILWVPSEESNSIVIIEDLTQTKSGNLVLRGIYDQQIIIVDKRGYYIEEWLSPSNERSHDISWSRYSEKEGKYITQEASGLAWNLFPDNKLTDGEELKNLMCIQGNLFDLLSCSYVMSPFDREYMYIGNNIAVDVMDPEQETLVFNEDGGDILILRSNSHYYADWNEWEQEDDEEDEYNDDEDE